MLSPIKHTTLDDTKESLKSLRILLTLIERKSPGAKTNFLKLINNDWLFFKNQSMTGVAEKYEKLIAFIPQDWDKKQGDESMEQLQIILKNLRQQLFLIEDSVNQIKDNKNITELSKKHSPIAHHSVF
jgi:hypothetical protein